MSEDLPIVCTLSETERASWREQTVETLFKAAEQVEELADGYGVRFPGGGDWPTRLLAFTAAERECCRFFRFELAFEPDLGPIWLRLRGPEGVKSFLHSWLEAVPS